MPCPRASFLEHALYLGQPLLHLDLLTNPDTKLDQGLGSAEADAFALGGQQLPQGVRTPGHAGGQARQAQLHGFGSQLVDKLAEDGIGPAASCGSFRDAWEGCRLALLRTDSTSLLFYRQYIIEFCAWRTDSTLLRWWTVARSLCALRAAAKG